MTKDCVTSPWPVTNPRSQGGTINFFEGDRPGVGNYQRKIPAEITKEKFLLLSKKENTAALLFNNLPKELKTCDDVNIFTSRLFKYLRNRAKTCLQ